MPEPRLGTRKKKGEVLQSGKSKTNLTQQRRQGARKKRALTRFEEKKERKPAATILLAKKKRKLVWLFIGWRGEEGKQAQVDSTDRKRGGVQLFPILGCKKKRRSVKFLGRKGEKRGESTRLGRGGSASFLFGGGKKNPRVKVGEVRSLCVIGFSLKEKRKEALLVPKIRREKKSPDPPLHLGGKRKAVATHRSRRGKILLLGMASCGQERISI